LIGPGIVRGGEKISRRILIMVCFPFISLFYLFFFFFFLMEDNLFGCEENCGKWDKNDVCLFFFFFVVWRFLCFFFCYCEFCEMEFKSKWIKELIFYLDYINKLFCIWIWIPIFLNWTSFFSKYLLGKDFCFF
jgi:hypothetical protein